MKQGRKSKNIMRQAISYILSFMLSVCITLMTLLLVINFGGFSEDALYSNMSSHGYYDYVYNDFMENVKAVTIPTGFPESIYEGILSKTDVYNDINGSLKAEFNKTTYSTKAQEMKRQLRENIDTYFTKNEYAATDEEKAAINEYVDAVSGSYDKYIKLPLGTYILDAKRIFDKVFWIAMAVLFAVSVVAVAVLLKLHKWKHRSLRYLSYSLLASAVMVTVYPAYLYIGKAYYRLNLSPESFYNLAIKYIDNLLELFLYFGLFWLILGIVFVCTGIFVKNNEKRHHKSRSHD